MRIIEISCIIKIDIIKTGIKEQSVSKDRQVAELKKFFNVNGSCNPQIHYMIDLSERLSEIKKMVDAGEYFTINRARQYGKTTLLAALAEYLKSDYKVVSLDFQTISYGDFENEEKFVAAFSNEILISEYDIPEDIRSALLRLADGREKNVTLSVLFRTLLQWCRISEKPLVLIIDEVDTATNNQVFVDFLAQLRAYYLRRMQLPAFRSVILAGVYDVRNVKSKIRPEENHKTNSPWNIAAKFKVDMNFSVDDISGMLNAYERDYRTGMDIKEIAGLIYSYTSGYPYLVSCICKMIDEDIKGEGKTAWSKQDVLTAVKMLLNDKNPLFESLIGKLNEYPGVKKLIYRLLFRGENIGYNPDDSGIDMAEMFGFIKVRNGNVYIANRIFETRLYNMFLMSTDEQEKDVYREGARLKNQFIRDGALDMRRILEKFVEYFDDIYGDRDEKFLEADGRRYFMLFLKPIINGTGNYYIEARTRNDEQTDMIIDYLGQQYIIEMKIWHGNAYNERGEKQLSDYLEYYHVDKGYMLSFNFNKNKKIGVKEVILGEKLLIEAVV